MADTPLRPQLTYSDPRPLRGVDWSAVWGGVFVFAAIWSIFEMLALAIFGPSQTANLASGMNTGLDIWTIVLTIIAMYVAGRATGQLAGLTPRQERLMHGMMMFGLAVVSALVLDILAGAVFATSNATAARISGMHAMSVATEWTVFLSLFLGWLAAMGGASTGTRQEIVQRQPVQMRPAV